MTLAYALFTAEKPAATPSVSLSLGGASAVIALEIVAVIDLPTYFRHARTCWDGLISIAVVFGLTLPVLEIIGVYLASGNAEGTILDVLKQQNGLIWNVWVSSFLILAGWTTNNINIYSGSVCLEPLLKNCSQIMRTLLVGVLGTGLSFFNLLNHFEAVLGVMGVFIASMGTVIIMRYSQTLFSPSSRFIQTPVSNLAAWSIGIIGGCVGMLGFSMTAIPVLDAAVGASVGTLLIPNRRETYEKAYSE
jgi:purine-cytosine permease-like protein